ncbi:GDNF-inducible zinc finger protein 1-like [Asbolus verrucosus]|uniref:GDNF-inducible zinc finger protein 1-like n=1 Tax=Asbolus verrucosus TaxID=1661398 RepID=A0A482VII8_ASBVE|nr:GDNF-inducible zinc finger protein 1-like [Asbolus verrucosus]
MSENNLEMDENEIHYVYEDQEFVLDKEEINPELRDLICAEGSRALLVDGQYILTDSQAILLQEGDNNLTQYYINDNTEGFIVDGEDASVNSLFESTEILQLVEEDTNGDQQIIYYTNENPNTEEFTTSQDIPEQNGVEGIQDEDGNIYPFKRIKLEGQMLQFDEFVPKQENVVMSHQADDEHNSVQYAIMEDGNFQISSFSTETQPIEESESDKSTDAQLVDLSKITGRNLITGQTVTLHSYMEKLKKKLKNNNLTQKSRPSKKIYDDEVRRPELSDLLDRKISIGKTKSGKKIVGKIIHIERKGDALKAPTKESEEEEEEEEVDDNLVINDHLPETVDVAEGQDKDESPPPPAAVASESEEAPTSEVEKAEDQTRILVKKCSVSKDSFEQISKTLGGVMEMESVRKKLENKNIVVKLVEKRYVSETDTVIKSTSYSYGYMEKDTNQVVEDEVVEKWRFVPDQNTQDVLLGDHITSEGSEDKNKSLEKKST